MARAVSAMTDPTAPERPILALTIALAGKREVSAEDTPALEETLALAFNSLGGRLLALGDAGGADDPMRQRFRAESRPRLSLVTGLADGADQIASRVFLADHPETPDIERVLGAVLPAARAEFVAQGPVADVAGFEAAARRCAFVVELDGALPLSPAGPPDDETRPALQARRERGEAFSAQSEFLLRLADILVAVDDAEEEGRIGGTRQTIRAALDLATPVILLRLGHEGLAILRSRADFDEPTFLPEAAARGALWLLVGEMIGVGASAEDAGYARHLIGEFYAAEAPRPGWLNRLWDAFEAPFKPSLKLPRDLPTAPYRRYRDRASALSAYYSGLYRGSFLVGYALAVVAVILAGGALVLLVVGPALGAPEALMPWLLAALGLGKLAVVVLIARLAERANHERLAHRAADYRYLSERLRAMTFLPRLGSLRAPYNWSLPYTTRVTAQGVIDRLFLSIIRQARPLEAIPGAAPDGLIRPDAREALSIIRHNWIEGQKLYHQRNHATQSGVKRSLESLSRALNLGVIGIVGLDLAVSVAAILRLLPEAVQKGSDLFAVPALIGLAAILPAAVASLNGVRFQSECARLSDRSDHMAARLGQLEERAGLARLRPPRLLDVLRLAEDVARSTVDEVAEWSAVYGKEFVEM
jgi:hypothetical protein